MSWLTHLQRSSSAALSDGKYSLSYSEMCEQVRLRREWLAAINPKAVALDLANSIEWVLFDIACAEGNIPCIPIPTFFTRSQRDHAIHGAAVELVLTSTGHSQLPVEPSPFTGVQFSHFAASAVALPRGTQKITYTSGSTGHPKGVCLSHQNQLATALALKSALQLDNPVHLCVLPLATLLENVAGVYTPLLCNGTVYLPSNADLGFSGSRLTRPEKMLHCISQFKPDTLIIVPELLLVLVNAVNNGWIPPRTLRFIAVGGARVSPQLLELAHTCALPVYQGYGLSECGSVVAINTPHNNNPGTMGKTLPHVQTSIVDGELQVAGNSFLGYLGKPESWHQKTIATGDIVRKDNDNWLWFEGRRRNQIISSMGRNINPEWPESELLSDGCLRQAVVLGDDRPHCIAIVTPTVARSTSAWQHWLQAINKRLPDYAQIKQCLLLNTPMTAQNALVTDNGRPRRPAISTYFSHQIDALYASPQETIRPLTLEV